MGLGLARRWSGRPVTMAALELEVREGRRQPRSRMAWGSVGRRRQHQSSECGLDSDAHPQRSGATRPQRCRGAVIAMAGAGGKGWTPADGARKRPARGGGRWAPKWPSARRLGAQEHVRRCAWGSCFSSTDVLCDLCCVSLSSLWFFLHEGRLLRLAR
jgi:hypothetical protein